MTAEIAQLTAAVHQAELDAAELSLQKSRITAPTPGLVVEINRHVGNWVAPGDPVIELVRMDRLRVEGFLKITEYQPAQIEGCPVQEVLAGDRDVQRRADERRRGTQRGHGGRDLRSRGLQSQEENGDGEDGIWDAHDVSPSLLFSASQARERCLPRRWPN